MQHNSFQDQLISENTYLIESFDSWIWSKILTVETWVTLTYLILVKESLDLDLRIESGWEKAEITIKALCVAKKQSNIKLRIHAHLQHNYATADIHMISLLQDWSVCEIDGWVDLHAWVHKISGHLLEENIILWDKIKIKTLPMLDVRSSDVSASHGARIERLDEKKMFYLKSRGLSDTQAKELMIWGYFEQVFGLFKETAENLDVARLEKEWLDYLLHETKW